MQLKSGTLLQGGKYRIIRTLGQGGFGITYEAEQVLLRRKVALKEFFMKDCCERDGDTCHVTVGTGSQRNLVEKFRGKFIREAQMIAGMEHPNIIRVTDVFEENGTAYYVMDYLPGGSLADKAKKDGPLTEAKADEYIRQVADALSYIHSRNTVHLDVKPSNILLNAKGEAVLIDFGISKHYDDSGEQTSSTPVGISKGYAPLEQGRDGDVSQFKPSTDIYALGATLYYLVSGMVPPEASLVNEDGLKRPDGISGRIWEAIEQAMQPKRKDRPQIVPAFLSFLDADPIESPLEKDDEVTLINMAKPESALETEIAEYPPSKLKLEPESQPKDSSLLKKVLTWIPAILIIALGLAGLFSNLNNTKRIKDLPVEEVLSLPSSGVIDGHEYVDLGLSVKWATCNVGASSPVDFGDYFAWGETSPKIEYTLENYKFRVSGDSFDNVTLSKYNTDSKYGIVDNNARLEMSDDAASANWGDSWRMPTDVELTELRKKCIWTRVTLNGKIGYKVTSKKNGNTIFLPAAGYMFGATLMDAGSCGYYRSSTLCADDPHFACSVRLISYNVRRLVPARYMGQSVRPVTE